MRLNFIQFAGIEFYMIGLVLRSTFLYTAHYLLSNLFGHNFALALRVLHSTVYNNVLSQFPTAFDDSQKK